MKRPPRFKIYLRYGSKLTCLMPLISKSDMTMRVARQKVSPEQEDLRVPFTIEEIADEKRVGEFCKTVLA